MPHRLHIRRRSDQLAITAAVLAGLALIVSNVVGCTTLKAASRADRAASDASTLANLVRRNSTAIGKAVCPVIDYAETQAWNIRHPPDPDAMPNRRAARELEQLGRKMRETGIPCPPREQKRKRRP